MQCNLSSDLHRFGISAGRTSAGAPRQVLRFFQIISMIEQWQGHQSLSQNCLILLLVAHRFLCLCMGLPSSWLADVQNLDELCSDTNGTHAPTDPTDSERQDRKQEATEREGRRERGREKLALSPSSARNLPLLSTLHPSLWTSHSAVSSQRHVCCSGDAFCVSNRYCYMCVSASRALLLDDDRCRMWCV
jgi:hypothetical protein